MPSKTSKERLLGPAKVYLVNGSHKFSIPRIWFSLCSDAKLGGKGWFYLDEQHDRIIMSAVQNKALGAAAPKNPYMIAENGTVIIPLDFANLIGGIGDQVMIRVDAEKNLVIEKTA